MEISTRSVRHSHRCICTSIPNTPVPLHCFGAKMYMQVVPDLVAGVTVILSLTDDLVHKSNTTHHSRFIFLARQNLFLTTENFPSAGTAHYCVPFIPIIPSHPSLLRPPNALILPHIHSHCFSKYSFFPSEKDPYMAK